MKPLPKFTAVVHVLSGQQAVEQTGLVLDAGAGGVFLIDHKNTFKKLLTTYQQVRERFPQAWVGLNFLDLSPYQAIERCPADADALWMDNMEDVDLLAGQPVSNPPWRLFAGAAFKYQPQYGTPREGAMSTSYHLRPDVDVVTTSGPGTGQPATTEKVRSMKEAIEGCPLALASGVTPENVAEFAPYVDCFLVATGISESFHVFDPKKVRRVADQLSATV